MHKEWQFFSPPPPTGTEGPDREGGDQGGHDEGAAGGGPGADAGEGEEQEPGRHCQDPQGAGRPLPGSVQGLQALCKYPGLFLTMNTDNY